MELTNVKLFDVNGNLFYAENPQVQKNTFIGRQPNVMSVPRFEEHKDKLPIPIWEGHEEVIECYYFAWQSAFGNLREVNPESGLISPFIDTAFNGNLFMWDSAFNVMYGKYANHIFDFQQTLDNFYARQHFDGFICRELSENMPGDRFSRDDPGSTGPNILPWAEWEYFLITNNIERLNKVFDPLCAYYKWFQNNRSWQDGSYWSCGLACGMDNQPRQSSGYDPMVSHGFMSWIDTCAQQYLSANMLLKMAEVLDRDGDVDWLNEEVKLLYNIINAKMWSKKDSYYYDTRRDGTHSGVKTIGAYWTLLAELVPKERLDGFVSHLENKEEFNRPHRIPTLAADHPDYNEEGGYFCGGVWPQTNYMVMCGLFHQGYKRLAYDIACNHVEYIKEVYLKTGNLYENYAPESATPGKPAKAGYVGWAGLGPIAVLFEFVFGIHQDAMNHKITWYVNRLERHGIKQYPLGEMVVDLICEARSSDQEEPQIQVQANGPVTVEIIWNGQSKIIKNY